MPMNLAWGNRDFNRGNKICFQGSSCRSLYRTFPRIAGARPHGGSDQMFDILECRQSKSADLAEHGRILCLNRLLPTCHCGFQRLRQMLHEQPLAPAADLDMTVQQKLRPCCSRTRSAADEEQLSPCQPQQLLMQTGPDLQWALSAKLGAPSLERRPLFRERPRAAASGPSPFMPGVLHAFRRLTCRPPCGSTCPCPACCFCCCACC